jgi:hypothetical protein
MQHLRFFELVEDGRLRHVRRLRDFANGHVVEPFGGEQRQRMLSDGVPPFAFLPFTPAFGGRPDAARLHLSQAA